MREAIARAAFEREEGAGNGVGRGDRFMEVSERSFAVGEGRR